MCDAHLEMLSVVDEVGGDLRHTSYTPDHTEAVPW